MPEVLSAVRRGSWKALVLKFWAKHVPGLASAVRLIRSSGLFDPAFYRRSGSVDIEDDVDLLIDFLTRRDDAGGDPHPLFDVSFYLEQNPDVAASAVNPLLHFVTTGSAELRSPHPLFDSRYYAERVPDLDPSRVNPLLHFLRNPPTPGLDPHPLFDVAYYLAKNPDVLASGMNPLLHFLSSGAAERRNPHPLVDMEHLCSAPAATGSDEIGRLVHYLSSPPVPGFDPHPLFDTRRLLVDHPSTTVDEANPLVRFLAEVARGAHDGGQGVDLFDCLACFVGVIRGRVDPESVPLALIEKSREPQTIGPVVEAIDRTFQALLFRRPQASELAFHLANFFHGCPTPADRRQAVASHSIARHLGIRPLRTNVDTVNRCNLRCIMCYFSNPGYSGKRNREMSIAEFRSLADALFPHSSQVFLSFGYEPLCHSCLDTVMRITAEYEVPFVTMTTNALLFSERTIEAMIEVRMNRLYISTDASTDATYRRIRRGGSLARLFDRVEAINRAKSRTGCDRPRLSFNFVMLRSNVEELPELIRIAKALDVDSVEAIHAVPYTAAAVDIRDESLWYHKELSNRVLDEAREVAARLGVGFACPEPFSEHADGEEHEACTAPPSPVTIAGPMHSSLATLPFRQVDAVDASCYWPWHFVGIDPYGNVNPCGWWHQAAPMGNVFEESFGTIWQGPGYTSLRDDLSGGSPRPACMMCPANGSGSTNCPQAFQAR